MLSPPTTQAGVEIHYFGSNTVDYTFVHVVLDTQPIDPTAGAGSNSRFPGKLKIETVPAVIISVS